MQKKADPVKWGIWGAVICTVIVTIAKVWGENVPYTAYATVILGYFWGAIVAQLKNWMGKKMGLPLE